MNRDPCIVLYIASKIASTVSIEKLEDRLLLQKIGYIVQEILGRNLGYRFSWYSYGPYSRSLSRDLHRRDELCLKAQVRESGEEIELVDRFAKIYAAAQSVCREEPMPRVLEIIASLHMLAKNTYPPSEDPVGDLTRIKPYIRRTCAEAIYRVLIDNRIIDPGKGEDNST